MDNKAKNILLKAYWGSGGWKDGIISEDDRMYAMQQGAMFAPSQYSHDETIENTRRLCIEIDLNHVVSAFLYSLSTRALEYRSALGSYIYSRSIPDHRCTDKTYCNICGFNELENNSLKRTWDVYNFERYKWGGVRHDHLSYAMFDLIQFKKLPLVTPSDKDIELFKEIIKIAKDIQSGGPRDFEKMISSIIPSNKAEREMILSILGICSILETPEHKGFLDKFVPMFYRDPPAVGKANDWHYPISWWKAHNGVNESALNEVFGNFLS